MSDAGAGTPAVATPAATPAATDGAATPAPAVGPRRAAPGLSHERASISLTQGVAALRRGAAAAPATPAATTEAAAPPPQTRAPATRQSPNALAAAAAAAGDGSQERPPQQQPRQAEPRPAPAPRPASPLPASPLDALMEAWLPRGEGDAGQQHEAGAGPQPAPTNTYLQGVPLKIGNEERHYSVPELTEAVSKAADYTQKTRALSEQARQLNERTATIDQLLPILVPEIERQLANLNGDDPEPDWHAVPPAEYQQRFAEWRTRQRTNESERNRLAALQQAAQRRETEQRMERVRISHAELVRTVPGWGQENTRNQLVSEMRQYGLQNGYPAAELDSIVEARHVKTLLMAMVGERIMAGARTQTLTVPQVRRGGAPPPPAPAALRSAEERFNANPTNKTGLGLLMARRSGQGRMNGRA